MTATVRTSLGSTYVELGEAARARPILEAAAVFWERAPGTVSAIVASYHLNQCLLALDEPEGAARAALGTLVHLDEPAGQLAYYAAHLRMAHAEALIELDRFEEAERELLAAHAAFEAGEMPEVEAAALALIALYERWGREEEAEQWRPEAGDPP